MNNMPNYATLIQEKDEKTEQAEVESETGNRVTSYLIETIQNATEDAQTALCCQKARIICYHIRAFRVQ